jgi:hypothetical protein
VLTQISDLWARRHGRARDARRLAALGLSICLRGVIARHDQAIISRLS